MTDTIKCPVCNESTPSDQEFCQHCQSRLLPTIGLDQSGEEAIKPGQAPTRKNTAELEPILPQWLRDARASARSAESQDAPKTPLPPGHKQSFSPSEDLLGGLRSQANDNEDDDTPDWLSSITGVAQKPKKPFTESPEVRRVELGEIGDFAQEDSTNDSDTPYWLAGLKPNDSQGNERDELKDWFRNADDSKPMEQPNVSASFDDSFSTASSIDDTPDWLREMSVNENEKKEKPPSTLNETSNAIPPEAVETPDWLRQMAEVTEFTPLESPEATLNAPELSIEVPDWLRDMDEKPKSVDSSTFTESNPGVSEPPSPSTTGELPAWLNNQTENEGKIVPDTTPKWLKKEAPASVTGELPAWLSSSEETVRLSPLPKVEPSAEKEEEPAQDDGLGDLPSWLKASAPKSTIFEEFNGATSGDESNKSLDASEWLSSFRTAEESQPEPSNQKETPFDAPPAFVSDENTTESMDNLFTEMPDWLSNAMEPPVSASLTPPSNSDVIAPGELPSWVQAMRPVDSDGTSSSYSDQTLESRGALAGLQGVLPSVPGFMPTSKPKPYSIKLQTSEEQLAHAELLEQILAAETAPVPIESFSVLRASRSLRWFLFIVLFAAVMFGLLIETPIFSMPLGVPRETGRAVDISRALPQGAPVLVAFDFEPSRVGEMEAVAAPFFDQLIFYSHPRLTFISTNETGALLAERFVAGPLVGHFKNSGFTYVNLGYLSGGQLGVRAFSQNPRSITPLDMSLQPAWGSTPDNLTSLSQLFMAMVLVTDNADAARTWIEQTESARENLPVVVISSAQAAPMIQPYFESQQVNGMVAGLYGGAVFEQNTPGTIKTARSYWNAYSLGMLLAMSLVLGGGLWNFVLGFKDRVSAREDK